MSTKAIIILIIVTLIILYSVWNIKEIKDEKPLWEINRKKR